MGMLDLVVSQLDRALEAINYQDVELAGMVVADDDRIDGRYVEVHQGVLSLLGRQALFLDDLRLAAALLHSIRCIERMGDQCANMAKLVPLSGYEAPKDATILERIEQMGRYARQEILQARGVQHPPRVTRARPRAPGREVNRLNREIFQRAVDVGDEPRCASGRCSWCSWRAASSGSATTPSTSPSRQCSSSPGCSRSSPGRRRWRASDSALDLVD